METPSQIVPALFDQFPFGLALLDPQGKVTAINAAMALLSGYQSSDLFAEGFYTLLFPDPDVNERIRSKILTAREGPFDDLELSLLTIAGDKMPCHFSGSFLREESALLLIVQDLTRKRAFEKVFESSFDNFIQVTNALDTAMNKINEQNLVLEEYKVKMTRELNVAKNVQKAIIPKIFPQIPNFEMYGISLPFEELGGDYFDYFLLEKGKIGILIADVSGHGMPSALITTLVKAYFEYYSKRYWQPEKVFQNVNRDISGLITDTGFFLTAWYGVLDLESLKISVAVAGHDCAICFVKGKDSPVLLGEGCEGTILGVFPEAVYTAMDYQLELGSKILLFTDGISEARSDQGIFYGNERLTAFLSRGAGKTPRETVEELVREVDAFCGKNPPKDDRTIVVFDLLESRNDLAGGAFQEGKKFLLAKDYEGALRVWDTLLSKDEESSELFYLAGQASSFLGRFSQASGYLEKAVRIDPAAFKAFYYWGLVSFKLKQYEQAETAWKKVLEIKGTYKDVWELLEKIDRLKGR